MELSFIFLYNNVEKIMNKLRKSRMGKMEWGGKKLSPDEKFDDLVAGILQFSSRSLEMYTLNSTAVSFLLLTAHNVTVVVNNKLRWITEGKRNAAVSKTL
jgi:hypothetical protein